MKFSQKMLALLFALLFIPAIAAAETMYVSDQLIITLRQGEGSEYKIIKTIKTGTPMEVLENKKGDEYLKVRLASGEEGYVLRQYLTSETPKAITISRLQNQLEKIQEQSAQAKEALAASSQKFNAVQEQQSQKEEVLTQNVNELSKALTEAKSELQTVTEEYNALKENAGKVVEITNERDRLKKSNEKLSAEARSISMKNSDLQRAGGIKWFLAGAGVLFFGWILGKSSRKKKSMY